MPEPQAFSQYGRPLKPTSKAIESKLQKNVGIISYTTTSIKFDNQIDDPGRPSYAEDDKYKEFDNPIHILCKS
jgi:hypothetical protein